MVHEAQTGQVSVESDVGWLLIGEGLACLRTVRDFLVKK